MVTKKRVSNADVMPSGPNLVYTSVRFGPMVPPLGNGIPLALWQPTHGGPPLAKRSLPINSCSPVHGLPGCTGVWASDSTTCTGAGEEDGVGEKLAFCAGCAAVRDKI